MSKIRVLVGTKKGAFILSADGKRKNWEVSGPHFAGWEMYHLKGSPVDPNRIYASQTSGWFGQVIQRSDDGGKTWATPDGAPPPTPGEFPKGASNKFAYEGQVGTHKWYDGTQHPWEFKRVWHLEPSLTDPDTVYAGVEDAAIFKSTDAGKPGTSFPDCVMPRGISGNPAPAAWRCTPSCSTRKTQTGCTSPFRRPGLSAPKMAARPGAQSTAG